MSIAESEWASRTLAEAEADLANYQEMVCDPIRCDRWVARSALQKAIRRGNVDIALGAAANLFACDPAALWRHLAIIATEDVGSANIELLASIVVARKNPAWRLANGGDWRVVSSLVVRMANSEHCQAACDLLLKSLNDPDLRSLRWDASSESASTLVARICSDHADLLSRSIAILALVGQLHPSGTTDSKSALEAMSYCYGDGDTLLAASAAWSLSRDPMALLLPLVQAEQSQEELGTPVSDDIQPFKMLGGVPDYAVDQFTRLGRRMVATLLRHDPALRHSFIALGVPAAQMNQTICDAMFLIEGGLVARRRISRTGDRVRLPVRFLQSLVGLFDQVDEICAIVQSRREQISSVRASLIHAGP